MRDGVTGSDEWELLAQDIHANGNSVRDAIAKHRPAIQREERKRVVAILRDYDCAAMTDESLLALLEAKTDE